MGEPNFIKRAKFWIAGIAWHVFLWGNGMSEDMYFRLIYEQEKLRQESMDDF